MPGSGSRGRKANEKMKVLVFGSLNIDRTYRVSHLVKPGETLSAESLSFFCGGKGFNQAIALKRAGLDVYFAGAVGEDGQALLDALDQNGIDRQFVLKLPSSTGHAVIQVDDAGQNSIIILAGTNGQITEDHIRKVLEHFRPGDLLVAQNEISNVDTLIRLGAEKGMHIAFNPAPYNDAVLACDLDCVDYLIINETEGAGLTGCSETGEILRVLRERHPNIRVVLTLGGQGSVYVNEAGDWTRCGIYPVKAVDTTAAGDTFSGYFLSRISSKAAAAEALEMAAVAAGISVSRKGAEPSIPGLQEVLAALQDWKK